MSAPSIPFRRHWPTLFVGAVLTLLIQTGCDSVAPDLTDDGTYGAQMPAGTNPLMSAGDVIEGHYLVVLSRTPAVKDDRADAALQALTSAIGRKAGASVNYIYRHAVTGFAAELTDGQVEELRRDPRVLWIEQDSYVQLFDGGQMQPYPAWGLDRIDQRDGLLDRAYAYTGTGQGVTAYIIDSGIRYTHDEFGGRASLGYDFVLEDDPNNTDPNQQPGEDCHGHGTHVAGTVGGSTYGVAKDVSLVSVRVFGCSSAGTPRSRYAAAIDWVTANAVHPAVVNMSLGFRNDDEHELMTETAISNSIDTGIHYVVAGGNSDTDACQFSPARHSRALTTGASHINNSRAWFSNYGSCINIFAPGVQITSAYHLADDATQTWNGTSMSAPHVAGVVALYLQEHPEALPSAVFDAVIANSTPDAISDVPAGPNNLLHSLWRSVEFTPPPSPVLNLRAEGLKVRGKQVVDLTWDATEDPLIRIYRNGDPLPFRPSNNGYYRDDTGTTGNDGLWVHRVCEEHYDNCSQEVTTIFGDGGGGEANEPPTADFTYAVDGLSVQFTDTSTDSDGSVISWHWTFGDGASSSAQNPAHDYAAGGTYSVTLTVTDDTGLTDSATKNVIVAAEEPTPGDFVLSASGRKERGRIIIELAWSGATSDAVDIYRDGTLIAPGHTNSGFYTDRTGQNGGGTFTHKVCEAGTQVCSNVTSTSF